MATLLERRIDDVAATKSMSRVGNRTCSELGNNLSAAAFVGLRIKVEASTLEWYAWRVERKQLSVVATLLAVRIVEGVSTGSPG